jgi:RimJ/RimL family protein N-acetyltransferase
MLIFAHDREICQWAGQQLGMRFQPVGLPTTIGIVRNGKIVGAALYSNYEHPNIVGTFVTTSPNWASRQVIKEIFHYPFVQLGCKRVTGMIEENNATAREFFERLGFKQEARLEDWFTSGAGICYALFAKDAARWLK